VDTGYDCGPATFLEEEWFKASPDGYSNFNVPVVMRIDGQLDLAALRQAVVSLVRRHEGLRTAFREHGQAVERVVLRRYEPELPLIDMSAGSDPELSVEHLVLAELAQVSDLSEAPLWRGGIVRVAERRHLAIFIFQHAIFDGWSTNVFRRDFTRLYAAALAGDTPRLSRLPMGLAEYAAWERRVLGRRASSERASRPPQRLPLERIEGQAMMVALPFPTIPAGQVSALTELAGQCGATPASGLRAAVLAALAPYLDGSVRVGFLMSGRKPETKPLIGGFSDHAIVSCEVGRDAGYRDLVSQVEEGMTAVKRCLSETGLLRLTSPWDRDLDVSINYMPAHGGQQPVRIASDPPVEISMVPVPMDTMRPKGQLGFPGVVPVSYSLHHDADGTVSGAVAGCAYRWGRPSIAPMAVVDGLARDFTRTVERVAAGSGR
jgi:hypothetical protein